MEFRILGPLEVIADGRPRELGGPKQRALLAVLLLEANRVVSVDRLVDALWDGGAPETASKALQVYVSQLRKLLGRDRLETKAPGYLLHVSPGELDAERFQALHEEGRFTEALGLWRGPALGDFSYQQFAQAETGRLEELRLASLEERFEHDLDRGHHAELIGELEALIAAHPNRERLRAQHMLALYRSGRQADALDAYQSGRTALVEELGIEPSRRLRELHQAILNQDGSLDLPIATEPPAKAPTAPAPTAEAPQRESRKTVSVLFATLSAPEGLDPETLRRVTGAAVAEITAAVERHGGTIESVAGEEVIAVFGLPVVHEDDALRAVRAAAELPRALSQTPQLEHRLAITTGEVVAGGDATGGLWATGDPLTRSARRARAAEPGAVVVDQATYHLVRDAVVAEQEEDSWRVLALADASEERGRLTSPMVGRDRERRRLHAAFEQSVSDRSCQLFTILGLAGVGKSRLLREFLGDLAGRALVASGRCLPYGEGITYWPLTEAIKEAVGLEDGDTAEEAQAKLVAALAADQDASRLARRVAETIGLAEAGGSVEERSGAVTSLFEAIARSEPLVLVFDDIHWGEPTFLDLVEHLAEWAREAPILLVCLARPELLDVRPGWGGGKLNATTALLEPLSDEECTRLIENLVGQARLSGEVAARIAEAAEGNPLFVEEMLSMLIDDGLLVRRNGRWTAAADISAVRVPPTIQALLAARLDQLGPDERAVIERAAVVGKVFYEPAVAELAPPSIRAGVAEVLGLLIRKELIRPDRPSLGQRTYRFRHLLIRDAAYDSLPKESRAELHERFGRWLERAAGERATEYEEVLGYHFEQAHHYAVELGPPDETARALAREAAERLGSAGRRAFVRSDAPAAVNLVSRAVSLLPADDPLRVELVPNVRAMQGMAGDLSWADRVLTEAVEAAATSGDRRLAAHALVQRGFLRLFTEPSIAPNELFGVADRAIAVFEEFDDELGMARAWRLAAQAHYLDRHGAASVEASERALAHVRRTGDRFEETEIATWLAVALALGSTPAPEATRRCRQLLAEVAGNAVLEVCLLGVLGYLAAMQNRLSEAEQCFDEGRRLMDELGEVIWLYWLWALMADPVSGERELHWATELLERIGEKSHYSSTAAVLARATYAQGRYAEAEQLTWAAEAASRPNDVHGQIAWRSTRAKVLARREDFDAAEELSREALAFAEESDFLNTHAHALSDLAEVLELRGQREAAAAALREAVELYERKGNVVAVERARALLTAL